MQRVHQNRTGQPWVEAGLGVTALPSLTFAMFKGGSLAVRPLIEPVMRRHVGFVTRAQRILPAFAADLKRTIRERLRHELRTNARSTRYENGQTAESSIIAGFSVELEELFRS